MLSPYNDIFMSNSVFQRISKKIDGAKVYEMVRNYIDIGE